MRAPYRAAAVAGMLASSMAGGAAVAHGDAGEARIAFSSAGRILTIGADGSDRRQISGPTVPDAGNVDDGYPAWSPDGNTIAFVRTAGGSRNQTSGIYLMDADGSDQRPLTSSKGKTYDFDPQWSPDGRWVVFARLSVKHEQVLTAIVAISSDGAAERQIVVKRLRNRSRILGEPAWSPDGQRIAFTATTLNRNYRYGYSLHVVKADGSRERLLAPEASGADWSPDGSRIAFVSVRDRNGSYSPGHDVSAFSGEIYVMNAGGKGLVRLTNNEGNDQGPAWSADGKHIAFSSDRNYPEGYPGESHELYSIEPDGNCLTWLTNGSPASATPDWEPSAGTSTAPGGCGATPRPPLVDFGPKGLDETRHPVLWLGRRYGTSLLSSTHSGPDGVYFEYADCAMFDPEDCTPGVAVQSSWICQKIAYRGFLLTAVYTDGFLTHRGALVSYETFEPDFTAYTGRAAVSFYGGVDLEASEAEVLAAHLAILDDLYGVGETGPTGDLPRAVIPKPVLRQVRRLATAYRRLGSFREVRRKLGARRYHVRNALILAKVLRKHGPVDKTRCPDVPEGSLTSRSTPSRFPSEPASPSSRAAQLARR